MWRVAWWFVSMTIDTGRQKWACVSGTMVYGVLVQQQPLCQDGPTAAAVQECQGWDDAVTDAVSKHRQSHRATTSFCSTRSVSVYNVIINNNNNNSNNFCFNSCFVAQQFWVGRPLGTLASPSFLIFSNNSNNNNNKNNTFLLLLWCYMIFDGREMTAVDV